MSPSVRPRTLVTYELHLDFDDGSSTFEPVICASELELLQAMRRIIGERDAASIEARLMGEVLFVVGR